MTPERWERVKAIFADAGARSDSERSAFVAHACGADEELREEVMSLLQAAADGGDSLPGMREAIGVVARGDREATLRATLESAIGQQYEIIRPIGRGGMGTVFLARERALERFVAIKVLRPELAEVHEGRERFRREARVAAQLSHPGIVPLYTFGEVGGVWYFVMGYVRGVTLAELLRVQGPLPGADARRLLVDLADALECAHRNGVIHRDIKPANILIDGTTGRAVLADFGIAKAGDDSDSLTVTGKVIGTPSFMSPEQAHGGRDVDARSDIYSLGAVGYAMLTGRTRFTTTSDLRATTPDVPPDLAAILLRCMAHEPDRRWPNARSLRAALVLGDEAADAVALELPAFGPYAVLWAVVWLTFAASPFRSIGDRTLLGLIALIVPAGLVLHVRNVAGGGASLGQLARMAFWPPDWWGMWWPRSLRRPSDLWRRLPWRARAVRAALSAFVVALPALILARQWVEAITGAGVGWFGATEAALVIGAAAVIVGGLWWSKHRGLTWPETTLLLFGSTTASSAWSSAALQRTLIPAGGSRPQSSDDPGVYRRAIDDMVSRLNGEAREAGDAAASAAERLTRLVAACDAELTAFGQAGGEGEIEHLSAQLATIAAGAHTDPEMQRLMELLRGQLDVMRRLRDRRDVLATRRAHWMHLLHDLRNSVSALHHAPDEMDRLSVLRAEIEHELRGEQ